MTETLEQTLAVYDAWLDRHPLMRLAYRFQVHTSGASLAQHPSIVDHPLHAPFALYQYLRAAPRSEAWKRGSMPQHSSMQEEHPSHHLQLGELLMACRYNVWGLWVGSLLLSAIVGIPVFIFAQMMIYPWSLVFVLFAVFLMIMGPISSYLQYRITIHLYEQGVVEKRGKKTRAIRWEEVHFFQYEVSHTRSYTNAGSSVHTTSHAYTIQGAGGLKIRFDPDLRGHEDLFDRITQMVTPVLLQQAKQRCQEQQEVPFGALMVSVAGIAHRRKKQPERFLSWPEVETTHIGSENQTVIKQRGNLHTWFEGNIPNAEVFHLLVKDRQEHLSYRAPTAGQETASAVLPGPLSAGFLLEGRYEVVKQLGEGGFGLVYQARDRARNGLFVAIKQIAISSLSPREAIEATESYHREIAHLSQLHHENLPRIYDHFTDQSHWYIVMEYIDGETIEKTLASGQALSLPEVIKIGMTLCSVLGYLHGQHPPIIFRDLKPSNLMRSQTGQLSLIDFGIALRFCTVGQRDTRPLGTPGYAAPEQYGNAQSTIQTDIYGLGATLLQLLTGKEPPDAQREWEELPLPEDVRVLLHQMLARDPAQRPRTVDEVKQYLIRLDLGTI